MSLLFPADASLLLAFIGVILFGIQPAIFDYVLKCVVHQPAITPLVFLGVAIDQLLLTKADQFLRENCVGALDRARSTKSPARTTVSLVFDS